MNTEIKQRLRDSASGFRLPRYSELPNVGLYLEQVAKYINSFLEPVGCADLTTSMISNYVKKGYIESPHKKQYGAEQIASLFFIATAKQVLALDNFTTLFAMQKGSYSLPVAYDYFCTELENMIAYTFGLKSEPEKNIGSTSSEEKDFLKYIIVSEAHCIYLAAYFKELERGNKDE